MKSKTTLQTKATTTTKIVAAALILIPAALIAIAMTEDTTPEMTAANQEVQRSAYEICKAYEKAGQGTRDCDEILK